MKKLIAILLSGFCRTESSSFFICNIVYLLVCLFYFLFYT